MVHKLRFRLLLVFIGFGVVNILVVLIYIFMDQRKNSIEKVDNHIHEIELKVYECNSHINDFFTYDTRQSAYFETGKSIYLNKHNITVQQIDSLKNTLLKMPESKKIERWATLNDISANFDSLTHIVEQISHNIYLRGFKDYGIEGTMRNHAHKLENISEVPLSDLLMLRRNEKDYIIRNEPKYISSFNKNITNLKSAIQTDTGIQIKKRSAIVAELQEYQNAFNKMVYYDKIIGIKDNSGLKAELERINSKILNDMQILSSGCNEYKSGIYLYFSLLTTFVLCACIIISLILSVKISKIVTTRISLLSNNISAFINSNFTIIEKVAVKTKNDEVGVLIENFEFLKQNICEQIRNLEVKVASRTEEINVQKEQLFQQNLKITDSVRCALNIQESILPDKYYISETYPEHFIFYKPKDIVSGDFYWYKRVKTDKNNYSIIVVADCTGHGVPGAFMSMLGISILNEITAKNRKPDSAELLNTLRIKVLDSFGGCREVGKTYTGMDLGLVIVDHNSKSFQFSGAFRDLLLIKNGEPIRIRGNRMPIGRYIKGNNAFSAEQLNYETGDSFYMFTDGFSDQFGGKKNQKYLRKRFYDFLLNIRNESFSNQKVLIEKELNTWMGNTDQTDDILVAGFKLS